MPTPSQPWVPSTPDSNAAPAKDPTRIPGVLDADAQKWRPQAADLEFTVFVDGTSTANAHLTIDEDFAGQSNGKTTLIADMLLETTTEIAAGHSKAGLKLSAYPPMFSQEHLKVVLTKLAEPLFSAENVKLALVLSGAPDKVAQEQIKIAQKGPGDLPVSSEQIKIGYTDDGYSISEEHLKEGLMFQREPRETATHIKVSNQGVSQLKVSSDHIKTLLKVQPVIATFANHLKILATYTIDTRISVGGIITAISDPKDLQNFHEHAKVGINDPMPLLNASEQVKIGYSNPYHWNITEEHYKAGINDPWPIRNFQEHAKVSQTNPGDYKITEAHTKVLAEVVANARVTEAHVKVWADIPRREVVSQGHVKVAPKNNPPRAVGEAHIKMCIPFVNRTKYGWGVLL